MATPQSQLTSEQQAASAAAVRILREIVDYQRRLRRLSVHRSPRRPRNFYRTRP